MDEGNTKAASGGMGLLGWLTVLFVGLKLTNNIDWSWWWVLAPLWIPLGIVAVVVTLGLLLAIIASLLDR
jgi:hypothetical protein